MKKNSILFPKRYVPANLSSNDKSKQVQMLLKSRKMYKQKKYYTRKRLGSFPHTVSNHVKTARKMYRVNSVTPNQELASATGCSISAMRKIVKKGEGAYYSSGSRPNQTPQSWGIARLASSLTGGKSAAVDFDILENGCNHSRRAFLLAKKSQKKYKLGQSKTRKVTVKT
jgi:hypothetical protein